MTSHQTCLCLVGSPPNSAIQFDALICKFFTGKKKKNQKTKCRHAQNSEAYRLIRWPLPSLSNTAVFVTFTHVWCIYIYRFYTANAGTQTQSVATELPHFLATHICDGSRQTGPMQDKSCVTATTCTSSTLTFSFYLLLCLKESKFFISPKGIQLFLWTLKKNMNVECLVYFLK